MREKDVLTGKETERLSWNCVEWDSFRKSLRKSSEWSDKDELLDVVYWIRQFLGAILGSLWGTLSLYGFVGIGVYLLITTVTLHLYVTSFQCVDEEFVGGFWELAKEGFMSSFATFLICWIIAYSALYH